MPPLRPEEVVRLMFEARAADDHHALGALMDPDIEVEALGGHDVIRGAAGVLLHLRREAHDGPRTELDAHRFAVDGDKVLVWGRIRVIDHGSLSDSPAAWRFTVRDGRVTHVSMLNSGVLPSVA